MDFVAVKRSRSRRKRGHLKKRRREQIKFEVKSEKRRRFLLDTSNTCIVKERLINNTMQANSFWENYVAAQEWQKRHNITWWRTRCTALEQENQILRDKLRSLACHTSQPQSSQVRKTKRYNRKDSVVGKETVLDDEVERIEFQVNEDMMRFLEQSIRHKIELKKKRESEELDAKEKEKEDERSFEGGAVWMQKRNSNAKLLYGEASPTILAMETALQTTADRHKDKAKPQYWPVIPLKMTYPTVQFYVYRESTKDDAAYSTDYKEH